MTEQLYPSVISEDPADLAKVLREIVRLREQDIGNNTALAGKFMAGRKVDKVPTDRNDVAADDREGDFNYSTTAYYVAVNNAGTLQWARIPLSTASPWIDFAPYTLPAASETVVGGVELLTNAEAITGTDTTRAMTAANFRAANIVLGTPVATTSGSEAGYTSIPSWARRITISLTGYSTNGTADILIQIGDSGGYETTGYLGYGVLVGASAVASANYTTGFGINNDSAASVIHGSAILTLANSTTNTWACQGNFAKSNTNNGFIVAGTKPLSATLDRVRVITTDTQDAGEINIAYE